ncbi:ubiquitinyl hydrolase [Terfezia boudieri ATCC MYA-4762]|uniref:Ubiquitin carboxyl-terminal hydrolase n=1 Tax=Terfezia boudieri ATCC MYA-4762 TaxID=1051890 RepID=A0A3N4M338_9PEZI|nr:ubiquitinyl hydrolase [Terfezia boudieri ATCC MYA-4762]
MSCPHVQQAQLQPPGPRSTVHREDCTQCFDSIDDPTGLNVCLSCYNGGCTGEQNHGRSHYQLTQHPLALNIRRTRKPKAERDEPPQKMSKLSIKAETEADKYDIGKMVICYSCDEEVDMAEKIVSKVVDGIMAAMTSARQTEVKAWEQELTPCGHTLCLEQDVPKQLEAQNLAHCASCDLKENLWLCLQCGNLGCGRAQFGGVGGNGHALAHFDAFNHPVAVKLGSITPEGTADIYCYACNDERVDPELATHLAYWGINIAEREKTEKSLTEMQIEQNLKWDFNMTTEDGKELKPVFGAGLTGLKNLGNSCYLNSILQCLFTLPIFRRRYAIQDRPANSLNPAEDLEIQLRKIADGLLSGRYSKADPDVVASHGSADIPHQRGLAPAMLKELIGKGHGEFSTMRQQDAFELLLHLFKIITRSQHAPLDDPVSAFKFAMEQRLQCLSCKKVSYRTDIQDNISVPVPVRRIKGTSVDMEADREGGAEVGAKKDAFEPVPIKECLDIFTSDEFIEYTCKACGAKEGAKKCSKFKTFPAVLAVNARRFEVINWVPTKLDIPVVVEDAPFSLDDYISKGVQPSEEELPEDAAEGSSQPKFVPNASSMQILQEMGFPEVRCVKALYNVGNADADTAMNWIFAHMDDADIDAPLKLEGESKGASVAIDPESLELLSAMGFTTAQAKKALKETGGNMERAVEWLFSHPSDMGKVEESGAGAAAKKTTEAVIPGITELPARFQLDSIVCHKGGSIHSGHYVAFVRKHLNTDDKDAWILFNDEKVVKAVDVDEMKKFAYIYFFKRV